jgi:hypothetical protein
VRTNDQKSLSCLCTFFLAPHKSSNLIVTVVSTDLSFEENGLHGDAGRTGKRSLPASMSRPTRRVRGHSQVFNESIALPLRLYMYR